MEPSVALRGINIEQYCTFNLSSFTISNLCPLLYHTPHNKQPSTATEMASPYSQYGAFHPQTMDLFRRYGENPRTTEERRNFYISYLEDVVPREVTVHPIPRHQQFFDISTRYVQREEIQLMYEGKIFMTCVVSGDSNPNPAEEMAAHLAHHYWSQGYFVRDRHVAWRMFTGLRDLRFCSSHDGREWVRENTLDSITDVEEVVAYFRQEFERVRLH